MGGRNNISVSLDAHVIISAWKGGNGSNYFGRLVAFYNGGTLTFFFSSHINGIGIDNVSYMHIAH